MSTPIQIANKALGLVGTSPISDFDDGTKKANILQNVYPLIRDKVLEDADWTFATKRAILTKSATVPVWGAEAQFDLPGDKLRVIWASSDPERQDSSVWLTRDFDGASQNTPWMVEEQHILTQDNFEQIYIIYIFRLTDSTKYSPTFVDCLSYALAIELCIPLTENSKHLERLEAMYNNILDEAAMKDGSQGARQQLWAKKTQLVR